MKRVVLTAIISLFAIQVFAQEILYSPTHREDDVDIYFEILGKVGNHIIAYKGLGTRHFLQVLDPNMKELSNERLKFLDDRLLNIDFVVHPDYFYMIYQKQKNRIIYCNAVKFNDKGEKIGNEITLDTTKVGMFDNNKIYSTAISEDRKKVLVYKMRFVGDELTLMCKRLDENLGISDSLRYVFNYNKYRDVYTNLQIANDGSIVFAKQITKGNRETSNHGEIFTISENALKYQVMPIDLGDKYIDDIRIKIDNLNRNFLINSFYYTKKNGNIEGLYTALMNHYSALEKQAFIVFPDSLRARISEGKYRSAFDDMFVRNTFLKRDGSFILVAEDYSSQTSGSNWNRWDYLYGNPYYYNSYYNYYPGYYNYYRPYNDYNRNQITRYTYNNIMLMSIDSSLQPVWTNIILKKQTDDNNDNYLSYGYVNVGKEIYFLFLEKVRNQQVVSNQALEADGSIKRFATLKSREKGYHFMPRFAKQVGLYEVVIPVVYRGLISFAKVDFSKNIQP